MILIDKAALLNRIATEVHYDTEHPLEAYGKLLNLVNDAPEAVVRCKDCVCYGTFMCAIGGIGGPKLDDYCSWGERKEDAEH